MGRGQGDSEALSIPRGKDICPDCGGRGAIPATHQGVVDAIDGAEPCRRCETSGFVDKEQAAPQSEDSPF